MTVATIATTVDGIIVKVLWNLKESLFIEEEHPEMIFQVKGSVRLFILFIFSPAFLQQFFVTLRFYVPALIWRCLVLARRAITAKSEDIYFMFYNQVYDVRYLIDIGTRYCSHHCTMKPCITDSGNGFQCSVERAWLAEIIVCLSHSVNAQLILATSQLLEPLTYLVSQMEGITHDGEWNCTTVHQFQEIPETTVQDGVSASNV